MYGHLTQGLQVAKNDRSNTYEVHRDGSVVIVHRVPLKGYGSRKQAERVAGRLMQRERQ